MRTLATTIGIVLVALVTAAWIRDPIAGAQSGIEYQDRGNRHEGVRSRPVSGYEIELLSALVDYQEPASPLPDTLKLRFFLSGESVVHLVVRELELTHYYWLDQVKSSQPWGRGYANEFSWSTDVVLKKLSPTMTMSELGALARLGRPEPSADERVAPLILYHTRLPKTIQRYLFALKTSTDARVVHTVFREGATSPIVTGAPLRPRGGRPFVVQWDATKATPGAYRIVLDGYALDSNQRLQQTVRFTHQPTVQ